MRKAASADKERIAEHVKHFKNHMEINGYWPLQVYIRANVNLP